MKEKMAIIIFIIITVFSCYANSEELTFELPDNEKMCFYEDIAEGQKTTLEFQVIQGGNYDCDMELKSPSGKSLYKDVKKQYDSYTWTTTEGGVYEFCFSNEFSTFTHKLIYFDFQVGEETLWRQKAGPDTPMTSLDASASTIYESLKAVEDYQTHHRLREISGRSFAEDLNIRVMIGSAIEFVVIIIIGVTQICVLRSFFSDKKNRVPT